MVEETEAGKNNVLFTLLFDCGVSSNGIVFVTTFFSLGITTFYENTLIKFSG